MKKQVLGLLSLGIAAAALLASCGKSECEKGNHNYELVTSVEATCTEQGTYTYICKNCGVTLYEYPSALGHDYKQITDKMPTCEEVGSAHKECNRCGVLSDSYWIEALGHDYDENNICTHCGISVLDNCKKGSHVYESVTTKSATCTEEAIISTKCKYCDTVLKTETLPALGHDFDSNNICTRCKAKKQYTITFKNSDGTTLKEVSIDAGAAVGELPDVSKEDSVFEGWYNGEDKIDSTYLVNDNLILEPKYTVYTLVSTKAEFLEALKSDNNIRFTSDINMEGEIITPVSVYTGILDGKGYTLKNFSIKLSSYQESYGLILENKGTIKDIKISDVDFNTNVTVYSGNAYYGIICGKNSGTISGIHITNATINSYFTASGNTTANSNGYLRVGGICGVNNENAIVSDSSIRADVTYETFLTSKASSNYGSEHAEYNSCIGGLIGLNSGTLSLSKSYITVSSSSSAENRSYNAKSNNILYLGGLIGLNNNGTITKSGSLMETTFKSEDKGDGNNIFYAGGVTGGNTGTGSITESYSDGSISGIANNDNNIGGIAGNQGGSASILNCYSKMDITGATHIGGIVGYNSGTIQNAYAAGMISSENSTSSYNRTGGVVGTNASAGVISKCYSMANINAKAGTAGYFVGISEGSIRNSYYTTGSFVAPSGVSESTLSSASKLEEIDKSSLTLDFMKNTMLWDEEYFALSKMVNSQPILNFEAESGHTWAEPYVFQKTCEDDGYELIYCTDEGCNRCYFKSYTLAAHTFGDAIVVDPTCSDKGTSTLTCSVCGYKEITYTDALGHVFEDGTVFDSIDSCMMDTSGKECTRCHTKIGTHNIVETVDKAPVCKQMLVLDEAIKDGYLYASDGASYEIKSEDSLSYIMVDDEKYYLALNSDESVFTGLNEDTTKFIVLYQNGSSNLKSCSYCGYVKSGSILEAHSFEPYSEEEKTDAYGHTYTSYKKKCSTCGYIKTFETVPGEHSYGYDGICIYDGCTESIYSDTDTEGFTHITTLAELKAIGMTDKIVLDADISLSDTDWIPLGTKDSPFRGVFDGNNHKITGMVYGVKNTQTEYFGLFGYNEGVIRRVIINSADITLKDVEGITLGLLCAYNNGTIKNCEVTGDVSVTIKTLSYNMYEDRDDTAKVDNKFNMIYGGLAGSNTSNIQSSIVNANTTFEISIEALMDISAWGAYDAYTHGIVPYAKNTTTLTLGGCVGTNASGATLRNVCCDGKFAVTYYNINPYVAYPKLVGSVTINGMIYLGAIVGYNAVSGNTNLGKLMDCKILAKTSDTYNGLLTFNMAKVYGSVNLIQNYLTDTQE